MNTPRVAVPHHRAIVAVDIEGSTARTNVAKGRLRQTMYELLQQSLRASKIAERHRDPLIDRGDGVLVLIHPTEEVSKAALLDTLVTTLCESIAEHNTRVSDHQFRVRVAVHAGEVHYDGHGAFGEALDVTLPDRASGPYGLGFRATCWAPCWTKRIWPVS